MVKSLMKAGFVFAASTLLFSSIDVVSAAPGSTSSQITFARQEYQHQPSPSLYDSLRDRVASFIPGRDRRELDFSKYTINEILEATLKRGSGNDDDDERSQDDKNDPATVPLRRLAQLIEKSPEAQKDLARNKITLLAPDDKTLTPPRRDRDDEEDRTRPIAHPFLSIQKHGGKDKDDDDKDEDRQRRFAKLVAFVLRYHTLPTIETPDRLADVSTIPTRLESDRNDKEPMRIRVEPSWTRVPFALFLERERPSLTFNFYSQLRGPTIVAKNGNIIMISSPLLPPFTPLNDLFLYPHLFSTLTSDLQRVGLDREIMPSPEKIRYGDDLGREIGDDDEDDRKKGRGIVEELIDELVSESNEDVTIFAPTNMAFDRLGRDMNAFLHSPLPISRRALKYILSYHIVPSVAFYSDYVSNSSAIESYRIESGCHGSKDSKKVAHYRLPTLLSKCGINDRATLLVDVVSFRRDDNKGPIEREVIVVPHKQDSGRDERGIDQPVRVWRADAVARQGAVHSINSILLPPYPKRKDEDKDLVDALDYIFA